MVEVMRTSRITGVVLGMLLAFSIIAAGVVQANPFSLNGGGQGLGTVSIVENFNGAAGWGDTLEDTRFGAVTEVQNAQNGRFDLRVSGDGEVAAGLFAGRKTCTMQARTKFAVGSNDSVSTSCEVFDSDRFTTVTVRGNHRWTDRSTGAVTEFSTIGT